MAIALTGAVIMEQTGGLLRYRRKCEACGYVEGGSTTTSAPSVNATSVSSYTCMKCRSRTEVRIQG
jgi:hypothetical protein